MGSLFEILLHYSGFFFRVEFFDLFVQFFEVRRTGHGPQAHSRPGLVDHVNGLVR